MISLLLGPDDFGKKQYISSLAAKEKAGTEFFVGDEIPPVDKFLEQDLFSLKKIFVMSGLLSQYDLSGEILDKIISSTNQIFFLEEKIDKRLAGNKLLLANKKIETKQFDLPHGTQLDSWIVKRVKELGGSINKDAGSSLAKKLGRDQATETRFGGKVVDVKEVYNLWQADSEIRKLMAYAEGKEISEQDVEELAIESGETDTLKITNAIGDNNRNLALNYIQDFLAQGGDNKSRIIQLNALLSEQFRNILVLQDFLSRNLSETEIMEKTKWKSGRLFVLKKIASRFPEKKVRDLLGKLAHLDEELKSSSVPPRVLLDLILAQLFL